MHEFGEQFVNGLVDGSSYAALGLSLVLILRITRIGNFAQGSQALVAVYLVWSLLSTGMPLIVAIILSTIASFMLGAILYIVIVRPVDRDQESPYGTVILTLGLLSVLQYGAQAIWGADPLNFPALFGTETVRVFGVATTRQAVGTIGVLIVLCILLYLFVEKSKLGIAFRAVAENRLAAASVGVPILWILALGWGIAAAIGAICGSLVAPTLILPSASDRLLGLGGARRLRDGLKHPVYAEIPTDLGHRAGRAIPDTPEGDFIDERVRDFLATVK